MDKGKGLPGLFDLGSVSVGPQQKIHPQEFSPSLKDGLGTAESAVPESSVFSGLMQANKLLPEDNQADSQ